MGIFSLDSLTPTIHPTAFVHPDATIIGNVEIGPEASVWPAAVIRGDANLIRIGARTSVQDGSVLHVTAEQQTIVGAESVIGHLVHLESCTIDGGALVGNAAVVLPGATVGRGAIVGSNAVVPPGLEVPPNALALGVPASVRRDAARPAMITDAVAEYVERAAHYRKNMRPVEG